MILCIGTTYAQKDFPEGNFSIGIVGRVQGNRFPFMDHQSSHEIIDIQKITYLGTGVNVQWRAGDFLSLGTLLTYDWGLRESHIGIDFDGRAMMQRNRLDLFGYAPYILLTPATYTLGQITVKPFIRMQGAQSWGRDYGFLRVSSLALSMAVGGAIPLGQQSYMNLSLFWFRHTTFRMYSVGNADYQVYQDRFFGLRSTSIQFEFSRFIN